MRTPYLLFAMLTLLIGLAAPPAAVAADLEKKTEANWTTYVDLTQKRIEGELGSRSKAFLIRNLKKPKDAAEILEKLKNKEVYVEKMQTKDARGNEIDVDGGIVHHWYGTVFIPNMTAARLLRWIQNYGDHHKYFKEVEKSNILKPSSEPSTFDIHLQLVRTKVVTVHYDTDHHVTFRQHTPGRVSSKSISTRIQEIESAGEKTQKLKPAGKDSGYFWHTNGYWRYEEADGGVYVECESLSLSRGIPWGVGWIVGHFVESVPRESLDTMLTSIRDGSKSAPR